MPCDSDPSGVYFPPFARSGGSTSLPTYRISSMQFWSDIFSVEIPSKECLSKVRSLLTCPAKITAARSFRGNQAQTIIDFLDRVSD